MKVAAYQFAVSKNIHHNFCKIKKAISEAKKQNVTSAYMKAACSTKRIVLPRRVAGKNQPPKKFPASLSSKISALSITISLPFIWRKISFILSRDMNSRYYDLRGKIVKADRRKADGHTCHEIHEEGFESSGTAPQNRRTGFPIRRQTVYLPNKSLCVPVRASVSIRTSSSMR